MSTLTIKVTSDNASYTRTIRTGKSRSGRNTILRIRRLIEKPIGLSKSLARVEITNKS